LITGGGGSGANGELSLVKADGLTHPNTYNIYISFISAEADTPINNTKYSNLNSSITDPANNWIANSLVAYVFSNVGPAQIIRMNSPGQTYTGVPSISIEANTRIKELGILGKMIINNGGSGYVVGDTIEFINVLGGYGTGGAANVRTVNATGAITNVQFMYVTGHPVGGSGYSMDYLPKANVISGTGTGANVEVTQLLGTGGTFIVANSSLGSIERISILNRGTGYTNIPTINLTQHGDGTAQAVATIVKGVFDYPGRWLNDDGHLSSYNFLENRDYYQPYSYVIRVGESISKYRKAIKDLIHPAGMKLFGQYVNIDNQEYYTSEVNAISTEISTETMRSYGANGNTIIYFPSHGLSVGNTVALKFVSGNIANYANSYVSYTPNSLYTVSNVVNSDYFFINSGTWLPGKANVSNVGTGFELGLEDLYMREDGRKLYTIGTSADRINEYDLSRTYDVTTAKFRRRHTTAFTEGNPRSFDISPDGVHVYVIGTTTDNVRQYIMSEAWNIQSLTVTANSYNTLSALSLTNVFGIRIKRDGTAVYLSDTTTDIIYQLSLSEAWNISTATLQTQKYFSFFEPSLQSMYFKPDGSMMYFTGATRGRISSVPLTTSWNINTANMLAVSNSFNIMLDRIDTTPTGIYLANTGNIVYISGNQHDAVYQIKLLDSWNVNSAFYMTNTTGNVYVRKLV